MKQDTKALDPGAVTRESELQRRTPKTPTRQKILDPGSVVRESEFVRRSPTRQLRRGGR